MGVLYTVVGAHNTTTKVTKLSVGKCKVSQIVKNCSLTQLEGNPIVLNIELEGISHKIQLIKHAKVQKFDL